MDAIRGGDAKTNLRMLRDALSGQNNACRDIVALNAGTALHVAGMAPTLQDGVANALELAQSGEALRVLDRYAESSQRIRKAIAG